MYWDDEAKTILRGDLIGEWTWADYHRNTDLAQEMTLGLTHRIDHIVDCSQSGKLPAGSPLRQLQKARQRNVQNLEIVIIVGADYLIKGFVDILDKAFGKRFEPRYLAASIEEAHQIIMDARKQPANDD